MTAPTVRREHVNAKLPVNLVAGLDAVAHETGLTRSGALVLLLGDALRRRSTRVPHTHQENKR